MNEICGDYVLINPYVWLSNACVCFTDRIEEVFVHSNESKPKDREVRVITHGMASTHTHLGLYPIRDTVSLGLNLDSWVTDKAWRWEKFLRRFPEVSYLSALLAITELLSSGVTAFADMHFNEEMICRAVREAGVRADLSVAIMDGGVFEDYEEALEENLKLLKVARGNDIRVRFGPCTPRLLSPSHFREVVELAKQHGVGVHTHLAEVREDLAWLKGKYSLSLRDFISVTGLLEVDTIVAHAVWAEEVADVLSMSNFTVSHPPRSNVLLGDGRAPIRSFLRQGVNVTLGVDVAPTYNLLEDVKAYIFLHYKGEGPPDIHEAFRLATTNAYRGLGFGSGDIVQGEVADLVIWSVTGPAFSDPLARVVWGSPRVEEVYVSGRLVLKDGMPVLTSLSLNEVASALYEYVREFSRAES
ncbi:MAG: amidohydrolase family protein [Zestosphaera sp.]